jgi:GNAT superfamily N-acetyltransferase
MDVVQSRAATMAIVRAVLAKDCACADDAFLQEGVLIAPAVQRSGRRPFPRPAKPLLLVSMGRGVVISCHAERIGWLQATLASRARDAIFWASTIDELEQYVALDGQTLYGPEQKFVCAPASFRPATPPGDVTVSVVEADAVFALYQHAGFANALSYRPDNPRPDVLAAVARCNGEIVGIAAASADCDQMWQIGVDVVPAARGVGVGRALISRLTEEVFRCGRVPYYTTNVANVRSSALATSLGYWPAWVELYARDRLATNEAAVNRG